MYLGENEILNAEWKRQRNSRVKLKRLAGFTNGVPFNRDGFSEPESVTNLTVQISVSSVEAEGQYICEFGSEEEYYTCHMFLTVVGKSRQCGRVSGSQPVVQMLVHKALSALRL